MRCVAITNQKGGVGKTTTTANLAAGLALVGRRVIAVDLDPQSNLTLHLRADLAAPERNAYALLHGRCRFAEALVPTEIPNLRLLPATVDLAGAEVELAGVVGRESLLRDAIREFAGASGDGTRPPAEFMLFDCPPSLGVLSLNALVAAREVLIPLQAEFLSLQGVSKLLEMVDLVRRRLNPALEVTGVLACMVNPRRNLATEVLAEIRAFFGPKVFGTVVRENVRLAEAPSHGKTIFAYAADSHGAADYAALAKEFLERPAP